MLWDKVPLLYGNGSGFELYTVMKKIIYLKILCKSYTFLNSCIPVYSILQEIWDCHDCKSKFKAAVEMECEVSFAMWTVT